MEEIEVIGPWQGGLRGERVPLVAATYACASWSDTSSQASANIPPGPNLCTVRAMVDTATRDAILADVQFKAVKPADKALAVAERDALSAYLTTAGANAADVDAALGTFEAKASAVIGSLRQWCRTIKAAVAPAKLAEAPATVKTARARRSKSA